MSSGDGRRRWLHWRFLLLVAGLLLIGVGVGLLAAEPLRLVVVDQVARYALFVAAAGFASAAIAAATRALGTVLRWVAPALLGVVALLAASLGFLVLGFEDPRVETVAARAADGRFELVHVETHNLIDPVDELVLRSNRGPLSRQDVIGCFNRDSSRGFRNATFTADDQLEVVATDGESWTLDFDPGSVKMRDTLPADGC